ncbi:hypothetical protein [Methyloferula stellata]|uniref:hypothetical protein n=1 Tax=Methyloferula stellata TaxID=876270 RepID=UPI00037BA307|nr:hypothetical protein [Methyloferula stellata]
MHPLVFIQTNKFLAIAALLPAAGVVAYGAFISVTEKPPHPSLEQQDYVSKTYRLSYADGQKAMFKTDYGASLVFIGSPLGETGRVTEIAKHANGWAVSTSKGYIFTVTR